MLLAIVFCTTINAAIATPLAQITGEFLNGTNGDSTVGWAFVTGDDPMRVTDLGVRDFSGDGLFESHDVGLWRASDQALLTSTTVPSGTGATLLDGFRYVSTTPVILAPNTEYVLGAHYTSMSIEGFGGDGALTATTATLNFGASFQQARQSLENTGFVYPPNTLDERREDAWFGPNLLVPEPSSLVLAVLGFAALAFAWRLKR